MPFPGSPEHIASINLPNENQHQTVKFFTIKEQATWFHSFKPVISLPVILESTMFNEKKAAQIAAWFLHQAGGVMSHLKLMKLMYLADRESMRSHGFPMTGDHFVSMPHGPVLSNTLSHINDEAPSACDGWNSWISDKANHEVALVIGVDMDALDYLSRADLQILKSSWEKFGHMTKFQIRDYTHDAKNCPEWKDPKGSSYPIHYRTVFEALGFPKELSANMAAEIQSHNFVSQALHAPISA